MILLLEITRGLAALWVFLFHTKHLFTESAPILVTFANHGHLGVPMFFVISGYVITHSAESTLKNKKKPLHFLRNRFLRIYPTFWASIIAVLLTPYIIEIISFFKTGQLIIPQISAFQLNHKEWLGIITLTKVFWATSSNLQAEFNSINSVYWTLAIEFQFYLTMYLLLHLKKYFKLGLLILSTACLFLSIQKPEFIPGLFIHYWPSFSIGILLAYIHKNHLFFQIKGKHLLIIFTLFTALIAALCQTSEPNKNLIFSMFFALFLWTLADFEKVLSRIKTGKNKIAYWILESFLITGAMSYSIYLLHGKIYMIPNMFVRQIIPPNNPLFGTLTIIGTLLLCYPFYYFIEKRFLSKNYKKIHEITLKNN